MNTGNGLLLGTFVDFDPYVHFVASADIDQLHKKSKVIGAVFHDSESYYPHRARHDSIVYV